ncbi:MAG TPA: ABC transporter ATP-binding protein [Planctomycetota bacterium]|nr:ABC transporter ATP-binding protein [Planctomycetota bacterium]
MEPLVEIRALEKRYSAQVALAGLDLAVPEGRIFGLLGENGAGKTTTLGCLLGLVRPDAGWARLFGEDVRRYPRLAARVGVSFENPALHRALSVEKNLEVSHRLAGRPAGRSPEEGMRLLGLEAHRQKRASACSRGLQQRAVLARALLGAPALVVLDEPLSGLDPLGVEEVLDLVLRIRRDEGTTFLISSHRLAEMERICDEVALVHAGRVVAAGALRDLLRPDRGRVRIEVGRRDEAAEFLRRHAAVGDVVPLNETDVEAEVGPADAARVNADLVRAGFEVSAFAPRPLTLPEYYRRTIGGRG